MNSLYTLGVRQTNSIQADLERLRTGDASASLLGLSAPASTFPFRSFHPECPNFASCRVDTARGWRTTCGLTRRLTVQYSFLSLVRADFCLLSGDESDSGRLRLDG